jgi:hypothetical protein
MLYLALTVLCIFYLIVLTIDWYDGVHPLRATPSIRQIAIDGRLPRLPDLELRDSERRADGLEAHHGAAQGEGGALRALHEGAVVRSPCWATTATPGYRAHDQSFSRSARYCRRSCCRRC